MPHNPLFKQYWTNRQHFSIVNDILLFDSRIVIPREMRLEMLNRLHEGHLGIVKCRALAQTSIWWPYISSQIEDLVNKCSKCHKHRPLHREPLLPSSIPERPWERVATDLLELKGKTYIVVVDYLSRWAEIRPLKTETSKATINALKSIFATHGIPDIVMSDNGPNFASCEFMDFAQNYKFTHNTSSPRYPQSNGEAERAVQTIKALLKKADDPYLALLMYRSTPLANGLSPAEILMGRKLQTKLPVLPSTLQPSIPDLQKLKRLEEENKVKQQANCNKRHAVRELPPLHPGDSVFIKDIQRQVQVIQPHANPRSYLVRTEQGTLRRNRTHIVATPGDPPPTSGQNTRRYNLNPQQHQQATAHQGPPPTPERPTPPVQTASTAAHEYHTRSGRQIKQPVKLNL
ncbi:hypothetical protein ACOMHN_004035 [Nucella lapillus]